MTEQQNIAKAYLIFGLEAGSSSDEVAERYKDLVMAWHSDRYPSGDKKLKAEEEMKKINNARDVLKKHFAQGHKNSGPCDCRPGAKSTPPPPPDTKAEEEAARKRSKERAAEAERARKAAEAKAAAEQAPQDRTQTTSTAAKDALEQQKISDDESLRWRLFIGIVAAWVLVSVFSVVTLGVEHVWHNIATSVEQMFAKHDEPKPSPQTTSAPDTSSYQQPQAPPDNSAQPPPQDIAQDQISEQQKRDHDAQIQKTADILKYQNDVNNAQKIIDHCNQQIAELDTQLANPGIAISEKIKLTNFQNQQRNYLSQAQLDMNTAQKMLAELTGKPAPLPLEVTPHVVPQPVVIDQPDLRRRANDFLNPNELGKPPEPGQPVTPQIRNFSDLLKPVSPSR